MTAFSSQGYIMSKIVKPDLTYQWASAAGGGSVAPSSGKIQTGHIVEKPNYEYMNWLQNRQDKSIAYTFQMGVPEWDSLVEYQYHANYKSYVQRNGLVYKALQVGTNKDPATEAAYWALAFDNYGSAATVQTNLNTHITNYGTLASLSNAATARSNLGVYSTTQVDSGLALKALLAGSSSQLFSAANGTAGYEVVNFQQLAAKAPVAGNSAQEFAVATATGGNNAVNKTQFDAKTGDASTTSKGVVEKATQAEMNTGDVDKFPDAATIRNLFGFNGTTKGHITLPSFLGGFTIQWGTKFYGELPSGVVTVSDTFDTTMDAVYWAGAFPYNPNLSGEIAFLVTTRAFTASNITVDMVELAGSGNQIDAGFTWIAIGLDS